jgi:hypothetical protein
MFMYRDVEKKEEKVNYNIKINLDWKLWWWR